MTLVAWLVVLFSAFIAGGGMYDLLDNPYSFWPGKAGLVPVHPYPGEQTLNESIVSMALTFFMFAGMLLAYKSTQVAYDSKRANTMLVIGICLVLMGLAGSHYLLILKRLARS